MRIGIIGDIHANLEALETVLAFARENGVENYICLGDIVGYNANPRECIDIVRGLKLLAIVRGNHDDYVSSELPKSNFNPQATQAIEWTKHQLSDEELQWLRELPMNANLCQESPHLRMCVVHGTLNHPEKWGYVIDSSSALSCMQFQWWPICIVGHTHIPVVYEKNIGELTVHFDETIELLPGRQYLINAGSIGQPRDRDNRASFAILDTEANIFRRYRLPYDIEKTQKKILSSGLPKRCAERLLLGR